MLKRRKNLELLKAKKDTVKAQKQLASKENKERKSKKWQVNDSSSSESEDEPPVQRKKKGNTVNNYYYGHAPPQALVSTEVKRPSKKKPVESSGSESENDIQKKIPESRPTIGELRNILFCE